VPLWNGVSSSGYTFTPYNPVGPTGASFTVTEPGTYLALYGLVANPNLTLARDFYGPEIDVGDFAPLPPLPPNVLTSGNSASNGPYDFAPVASCWIAVVVNGIDTAAVGAVPVALTWTKNNQVATPTDTGDLSYHTCAGFGQVFLNLNAFDIVQLKIYLTTTPYPPSNEILYISSSNLQFPYHFSGAQNKNSRGGTLTLLKIN
jgi:hypothetical protein